jgi:hypothetical protein
MPLACRRLLGSAGPLLTPATRPCPQADGAKFMCAVATAQPACVIYSLGSNGDVSFESDVIKTTPCQVSACWCGLCANRAAASAGAAGCSTAGLAAEMRHCAQPAGWRGAL